MKTKSVGLLFTAFFASASFCHAAETGLILLQPAGARAVGLSESYTAIQNDIGALTYNPAALSSLERNQAMFHYQHGLSDDTFGQVNLGLPFRNFAVGGFVSRYDSGLITLDDGVTKQSITGQQDTVMGLTGSLRTGRLLTGATVKTIRSELAETARAQATAADFGAQYNFAGNRVMGVSLLNLGESLSYISSGDPLPRLARAGVALPVASFTLFLDSIYRFNSDDVEPALAVEQKLGPLQVRGGGRRTKNEINYSFGIGFNLWSTMIDYGFAASGNNKDAQRLSLTFAFGSTPRAQVAPATQIGGPSGAPVFYPLESDEMILIAPDAKP